jgi:putative SOS response-associated peptidase YedK
MCGRFVVCYTEEDLSNTFNIVNHIDIHSNYNVTPLSDIPVIIESLANEGYKADFMQWGLIPYWSKDESIANKLINARAETISTKPSFKRSFQKRRCVIPASGFYEWHTKTKQPFYIKPNTGLLSFAGIWDEWRAHSGHIVKSCAIIITVPNDVLQNIHNRMPVILSDEDVKTWFDPNAQLGSLNNLLKPYGKEELNCSEVSKRVNSPSNNDPSLIESL